MKNWLSICALALSTTCLVTPAALAQTANDGSSPIVLAANDAPAATPAAKAVHHKRHHKAKHHHHHAEVAANAPAAGKAPSGGTSAALPPPPPPAEPLPAPVAAPPPPPPIPEIPTALKVPTDIKELLIGTQFVSGHNTGQGGRYNGNTYGGFDITLGFDVLHRDAFDADKPFYYSLTGRNLDIQTGNHLSRTFRDSAYTNLTTNRLGPEAEVNLSLGVQGEWGVTLGYNAITYTGNIISSLWTVNNAAGLLNNGLLPMGGASNTATTTTKGTVFNTAFTPATLTPKFNSLETGTRRDQVDIGAKYELDQWTFATHIQHESKKGSVEESIRQTWGGMAFTLPVDFDTDRFDVSASYVDPDYQALIQYTYSKFTDNNTAVLLPYAVSQTSLSATSGPYAQASLYATPPSNSAHYLTVMFNDKLAPHTRLTFNGRVGLELQDSTFAASSGDPGLSPTMGNPTYSWFANLNAMNQGTTGTSLNAKAWVYQTNVSFSTELAEHLDARVAYNLDGRDVSVGEYKVWNASNPDQNAQRADYVVPQKWVKQTGSAELNYLVRPESNTKITASYSFNNTNRTNAQVRHSETHTFGLNFSSMIGKSVLGRFSWEHANRAGELHYGFAWGNLTAGDPEENDTPSGAYYQAPMVSDSFTLRADYAPEGVWSGGLFVKYANNRFHYPALDPTATSTSGDWNLTGFGQGITHNATLTAGPDINYRPSDSLSFHAYYNFERIYYDNRGNGACAESNTGACLGSAGYIQNKYTSQTQNLGLNSEWKFSDRLKFSADYNFSYGSVLFGQFNGVAVSSVTASYQNVTNYPDIKSSMHDLKAEAVYRVTDNIEAAFLYRYSMFLNKDWQFIQAPVIPTLNNGTAISIVNAGYGPPNYNVSTFGLTMRIKL